MLQQTAVGPPPLPGGVAAVLRFFFNLPQWIQIGGFFLGLAVAAWLAVYLWRRRFQIIGWIKTRQRNVKIALLAVAAVVVLSAAGFGGLQAGATSDDGKGAASARVWTGSASTGPWQAGSADRLMLTSGT